MKKPEKEKKRKRRGQVIPRGPDALFPFNVGGFYWLIVTEIVT